MNNNYYISELIFGENHAGVKARNDAEQVFKDSGLIKLGLRFSSAKSRFGYYIKNIAPTIFNKIKLNKINGETIFFQYPITVNRVFSKVIKNIAIKNKVVLLIHDINYLRYYTQPDIMQPEISTLNCVDTLICHNDKMIDRLRRDGVNKPHCISLGLFDYLIDENVKIPTPHYGNDICFAGNLNKSLFLEKLATQTDFSFKLHLFGINYKELNSDNIFYDGCYDPESLISHLAFSYGLVWDGPEISVCAGEYGKYMVYNNPHKLSLYLAAGLPVIVWSKAAVADFVIKQNIGFTVDSLSDIDSMIEKIDEKQYGIFTDNVKAIQGNVLKGHYLRSAVKKIIG